MYTIFVVGTLTMVAIAFRTEVNLVREDYYQHSLQHDQHNAGTHHARALPRGSISAEIHGRELVIQLPFTSAQVTNGSVQLFRPSTATTDVFYPLQLTHAGQMRITTQGLAQGLWRVRLNFTANSVYYETEIPVRVP